MTKRFKSIHVHDLVVKDGRVWRVTGVYIGGTDQENIVGLKSVDLVAGFVSGVGTVEDMHVPEDLIDPACIFRRVDHDFENKVRPRLAAVTGTPA
jgi:hypothetical protein